MKNLLKELTEICAPSGYEGAIREVVRKEIKPFADEVRVDALGNLIARKGRADKNGQKIMLAAHMDEIGLIASHIDENGFVRFTAVGKPLVRYMPGGRVRFLNGTQGIVGAESMENPKELPPIDKMYIDVGATSRKDCPVQVGDVAAFERPFVEMGKRMVAKSMDDRAGVAALIETMRTLKTTPHEIYFVFTTQEEAGRRGATTAAFGLDPKIGVAVDITPAGDTPNAFKQEIALGKGPAIKIRDPLMLADPRIVEWMMRAAEKRSIPYQREVILAGGTDARAMQLTRGGVAAGGLSIPCRYVHSPSEMIDFEDLKNTVKLLKALLSAPIKI